ncbi:GGDEF domain-containing protein [Acinetobacter portensis]|uniref:GGDEF domain-containing protein n=2 Tax=Acinetobacter TaxID=469 RepID=A0AB35UZ03_9GAMM|nr:MULTISPECIES: GGDEF domain-containing protein [Acinetobacter]MBS7321375.1 GGDEF domain-containing protein [Myroides sp.]MCK7608625.1 GGDEF domain-containing protein [Acinetobacter portensis]MCK7639488.1 GGDEF domain-containing protein [Acinetobacter portensis]MDY6450229.1 GGDEF domain-containing protein [Acinetobacter faecalis]MDY6459978.1 GGDEF domain-containing protein [Acinetobacter faecalis]
MLTQVEKLLSGRALTRRSIIILFTLIMGWIDLATGYEYSFSVFYLIPVSVAVWYDNTKVTVLSILGATCMWLYADFSSGHQYTQTLAPYWNAFVRLAFFSVVAILLFKVRGSLIAMTKMAMRDSLTALSNSRAFQMQYDDIRRNSHKSSHGFAVGVIDLDGFKKINDSLGHSKGDDVLVAFAEILKKATRSTDIVARMGGDEFIVILKRTDAKGAEEYSARLRRAFNESGLKEQSGVDFSMGIILFDHLPEDLDDATHAADMLMYKAKALGKSQTTIQIA